MQMRMRIQGEKCSLLHIISVDVKPEAADAYSCRVVRSYAQLTDVGGLAKCS